jgi:cell division protein FtsZ
VATGLGKGAVRQQAKPLTVISTKTGTDNHPAEVDYGALEMPAVMRSKRNRDATIEAMRQSGVEMLDIPAFLRKQAD